MAAPRIVSLIASSTEMVCALGRGQALVGRSHECDYPPEVARLPACTRPKLDVYATSAEIDRQVKALVRNALSVYDVDAAMLRSLVPSVIVTQDQCEVCAVSLEDVERAVCDWIGEDVRIVTLRPDTLDDALADIARVARAIDAEREGADLVAAMRRRMAAVAERARGLSPQPKVALIEWIDPLMAAGNWMPELVALAGGETTFGRAGEAAPWTSLDELAASDADVIVVMPCGFDIARTRAELAPLAAMPAWRRLRAVAEGRVFVADGNQYFNRPGPRLADSLEMLAEMMHGGAFDFGHRGRGWVPL